MTLVGIEEGSVLQRRRTRLGSIKDRSFDGEGGGGDGRRIGPSPKKEVFGIGEGTVLQRRRRSPGSDKERSFNGEGGVLDRRRNGPSTEKEESWIGQGTVLQRRRRSPESEKEWSFNGEGGVLDRRRIGPSTEKEESWIGEGSVLQRRRRRLGSIPATSITVTALLIVRTAATGTRTHPLRIARCTARRSPSTPRIAHPSARHPRSGARGSGGCVP
jgi:hypothetical protein